MFGYICYQIVGIFVLLGWLPVAFYRMLRYGKYRQSILQHLALKSFPSFPAGSKVLWAHAVSVGEVRALSAFLREWQKAHPEYRVVISTTTETGQEEAKKSIPWADGFCYLPFDHILLMRHAMRSIVPSLVIVCESGLWPSFFLEAKRAGAKLCIINAKVSKASFQRIKKYTLGMGPMVLPKVDACITQNRSYAERFIKLGTKSSRVFVCENLKWDTLSTPLCPEKKEQLSPLLQKPNKKVLTIGSTHPGEEAALLQAIRPLWKLFPELLVVLVPRHPERFEKVAQWLTSEKIAFCRYSEASSLGEAQVLLVDKMGELCSFYALSDVACVAGSFIEGIGGHNVCEPSFYHVPVVFGPYMSGQKELRDQVLSFECGVQVSLLDLRKVLEELFSNVEQRATLSQNAQKMTEAMRGSARKTLHFVEQVL